MAIRCACRRAANDQTRLAAVGAVAGRARWIFRLGAAYRELRPSADFLNVPVWIRGGGDDKIAPPASEQLVYYSVKRAGFRQVRLEQVFCWPKINPAGI